MHVSRPCGATGSSSREEHSALETGTLGGQLHLCAQTHTTPGTWFLQGGGERSRDEIRVPRTVRQEGSDPERSRSQPEHSSKNGSPRGQAQSRRARPGRGARSRGVLFLLHSARSLTSQGRCSQVGVAGCGQRPLQTAGHRLAHLGSRLPACEPRGGARPSRPAQHSAGWGEGQSHRGDRPVAGSCSHGRSWL